VPLASFIALLLAAQAFGQAGPLLIQDAWMRQTPGSDVAAVYFKLRNTGNRVVRVVGAQSPIASHAMIHESSIEGGQSRMRPREQLSVAPGQTVKLEPGGLHLMLHGLAHPVAVGQSVPITLLLEGGGTVSANAQVRPLSAQ
jgi:copper(I)-binding protein